ncbi:cobalamin biosynthesis protein [Paraburkholderia sp. PREW-6R]|uniref:cobalamin biosynthesis protein n=1 Tax=Paraburkholderia sp. PREW-6R TaxID=3141544 RepID=UPI0031F5C2E1
MKTLSVGIGCRSGSTSAQIERAVRAALGPRAFGQIGVVASLSAKAREPGLLAFCEQHALPLRCFTSEQIAAIALDNPSAAVRKHVGVDGVCEPCALLAAAAPSSEAAAGLVVRKLALDGVTVAIASIRDSAPPASLHHDTRHQDLS